ncbi:hypothetical protein [Vallitalea okinawensis]|uniref:hypothetical protein n=1 Tax=Vallitalea okinawensis TaxID=2078660 RepID=UPI000CFE1AF4|nr:hypothetical protein [Vallitalea okinawensis]
MKNKSFLSTRNAVITLILFVCMYLLINGSPFGLAKLNEITDGHSILDMEMSGYTVDRAYEIFDALGEEGRAFNLKFIIPLDFVFPLSYGIFYFMTLTLIVMNIGFKIERPWVIGCIGLTATIFDLLENIMIVYLLQNYPQRLEGAVRIASIFTQCKAFFNMISLLLIVVGLLIVLIKKAHQTIKIKGN